MGEKQFIFREYEDSDLNGVLDLWEHSSGWGRPSENEFKKWLSTPFGEVIIYLALDNSERIIAQIFYTPTYIYLKGKEKLAAKVSAPIIQNDYRSSVYPESLSLMVELFLNGAKYAKKKGFEWLYVFPAYGWVKPLKSLHRIDLFPWELQIFSCLKILDKEVDLGNYYLNEVNEFSEDFNSVWKGFKSNYPNVSYVNRSIEWLKYKWGDELKIGIYDIKKNLAGYFIIKKSSGLILDFLMTDFSEAPTLLIKLKKFHLKWMIENSSYSGQDLKIIANDFLTPILEKVKTEKISYNFAFGISSTTSTEAIESIKGQSWFIFPND